MSKRNTGKILNDLPCHGYYTCHWTGQQVPQDDAVPLGTFYPGRSGVWMSAPNAEKARRNSHHAFNEMDANCNTCVHLERVKFNPVTIIKIPLVKDGKPAGFREVRLVGGFQKGRCKATPVNHPYKIVDGVMSFHPDDPMLMECYKPRDPWAPQEGA